MKKRLGVLFSLGVLLGLWAWHSGVFRSDPVAEVQQIRTPQFAPQFAKTVLIQDTGHEDVFLYLIFPKGEAANPFTEGLAHYVEHLAWLSAFGAAEGEVKRHANAWTNSFTTGYWQKAPPGEVARALQRLMSVADPLDVAPDFARQERSIVLREYDYRVAERPLYEVWRDMDRVLYGSGTLARSVIGVPQDIARFSLADAMTLHQQSHVLSDATLLVYGNITASQLTAALASVPSTTGVSTVAPDLSAPLVAAGGMVDHAAVSASDLGEDVYIYRKLVPADKCGGPAQCAAIVQVANKILNSALPGGLAGPLRFDQFVTRTFSVHIDRIGCDYIELSFRAEPDIGVGLEQVEAAFHAALNRTLHQGVPQDSFDRVTSRIAQDLAGILAADRPAYNQHHVLTALKFGTDAVSLMNWVNAIEDVRLNDVDAFLKSLSFDGREVSRFVRANR